MVRSVALGLPAWGDARDRVQRMIDNGADVESRITSSKRLIQSLPDELTYGGGDVPKLLKVAIYYNNGEAMKMLVDAAPRTSATSTCSCARRCSPRGRATRRQRSA